MPQSQYQKQNEQIISVPQPTNIAGYNSVKINPQPKTSKPVRRKQKCSFFRNFVNNPVQSCIVSLLVAVVVLGACLVCSVTFMSFGWLHTYRVFTNEIVVAEIDVSSVSYDSEGDPYIEIKYKPVGSKSMLQEWVGLGGQVEESTIRKTLPGDAFRVQADFFEWNNVGTLIGLKPMFRVTRIAGDYIDIDDYNDLTHEAVQVNGGSDSAWRLFKDHSESYSFLGTAYTSSAGQNATKADRSFDLVVTNNGLVIRAK